MYLLRSDGLRFSTERLLVSGRIVSLEAPSNGVKDKSLHITNSECVEEPCLLRFSSHANRVS